MADHGQVCQERRDLRAQRQMADAIAIPDLADYATGPRLITPQAPAYSPIATCDPTETCVEPWVMPPENVEIKQPTCPRGLHVRWSAAYAA